MAHQALLTDGVNLVVSHQLAEGLTELVRQFVALHSNRRQHVVAYLARNVRPAQSVLVIPEHSIRAGPSAMDCKHVMNSVGVAALKLGLLAGQIFIKGDP